eukprot:1223317-Ditylum_brightwellii.AAC.1
MGWANPQEEDKSNFNLNKNALRSHKRMAIAITMSDDPKQTDNNNEGQQTQNNSQKNTAQVTAQKEVNLPRKIPDNIVTLDILEKRLAKF